MARANRKPRPTSDAADDRRHRPRTQTSSETPGRWGSRQQPMTGAQASYLQTLSEEAGEPDAFDAELSEREAAKRIENLKDKLGLLDPPPHTD